MRLINVKKKSQKTLPNFGRIMQLPFSFITWITCIDARVFVINSRKLFGRGCKSIWTGRPAISRNVFFHCFFKALQHWVKKIRVAVISYDNKLSLRYLLIRPQLTRISVKINDSVSSRVVFHDYINAPQLQAHFFADGFDYDFQPLWIDRHNWTAS